MHTLLRGIVGTGIGAALLLMPTTPAAAEDLQAEAGSGCTSWLSGATGFLRCMAPPPSQPNATRFMVAVGCSDNKYVYGPWVRYGQTTWAVCPKGTSAKSIGSIHGAF